MAKKDLGLAGAVEKIVEDKVNKMQATGDIPGPDEGDDDSDNAFVNPPSSQSPAMKRLLTSFPSAEGYYAKIYKLMTNGKMELMDYHIEAPEQIPDMELEINRLAKEKGWGGGDYRIHVRNARKKGIFLNELIRLSGDTVAGGNGHAGKSADPVETLTRAMDVVDKIRGPQQSPEALGGVILKAVQVGRESATPPGNGQDTTLKTILELAVPLIKDILTKPIPPPVDADALVEKVVARIQSNQPKENFLDSLIKYEEVAKRINPRKDDALDSVRKVTDIVQAIRPLAGGTGGEPPSWGQLLLEHGSKLLEPIISTFKEWAEAKKMEMQFRIDSAARGPAGAIAGPGATGNVQSLPQKTMHPFAAKILKVSREGDESYFDMFRQQIIRFYGKHTIESLTSGEIGADLVVETLESELGLPPGIPEVKPYIEKFIGYLKESNPALLAECKTCHEQYDFPDMEAWEKDRKKCDECGGDIELVNKKQEGKA